MMFVQEPVGPLEFATFQQAHLQLVQNALFGWSRADAQVFSWRRR
jgi:hypothetical protein